MADGALSLSTGVEVVTFGCRLNAYESDAIAAQAAAFPAATFPKDPADRMIGATALLSGIALVTRDSAIRASRLVRTIW